MIKMKTVGFFVFMFMVALPLTAHAVTLDEANKVLADYDQDIMNLQKSVGMFEQVITESKSDKTTYEAYIGISRAYETMGDQGNLTYTSALEDYEQGMAAARQAMKLNPKGAMGYYWYVGNLGRQAEYKGVFNSLIVLPDLQKYLKMAYDLDKNNADILEAYGEMYYELQWVVSDSNGKAYDFLSRALKADPNLTLVMAIMGKLYIREGKYAQARKILQKIVHYKTPTYRADWAMYDKPLAEKLLDSIKDKK